MTENSILTIEQAAEFLGIGHIATLRKLARVRGKLKQMTFIRSAK